MWASKVVWLYMLTLWYIGNLSRVYSATSGIGTTHFYCCFVLGIGVCMSWCLTTETTEQIVHRYQQDLNFHALTTRLQQQNTSVDWTWGLKHLKPAPYQWAALPYVQHLHNLSNTL